MGVSDAALASARRWLADTVDTVTAITLHEVPEPLLSPWAQGDGSHLGDQLGAGVAVDRARRVYELPVPRCALVAAALRRRDGEVLIVTPADRCVEGDSYRVDLDGFTLSPG